MAINFLNTVNLNKNQLNNAAIQNLAADPGGAVEGQIYFNTVDFDLKIFANGAWKEVGATSGVETLSTTQAGDSAGNSLTVLTSAVGDVTINSFAYAGAGLVGYVPTGGTGTTFLRGDGAWIVPTDTGITSVVNVTGTSGGTPLDNAIVNRVLTLTSNEYAGGTNIGYVPNGGAVNQYLDGTGAWVDVTTGDIESVTESAVLDRLGIRITTPTGPDPVVGLDIIGQTNLGATAASDDELIIYDTSTTTNKSITVENLVGGYETTYDLTTAPTGTAVRLTSSDATDPAEDVTISGTTGRTAMTRISATELRVNLTDSIAVIDNIDLGGVITQTGGTSTTGVNDGALTASTALLLTADNTGVLVGMEVTGANIPVNITVVTVTDAKNFVLSGAITIANGITITFEEVNSFSSPLDMNNNRIGEVKTGVLGTDAVNLAQVNSLIAGIGVFKGGYDASTDPGTPVISGASNIALDLGDYFVVTSGGDITFSDQAVTVEVGDFIFAEQAITASSTPASTEYIIVIADANIATDGTITTAKRGVAGFDTTTFDVTPVSGTNPGFVTLRPLANPYSGQIPLATGDNTVAGETTFTLDVDAVFPGVDANKCKVEILLDAGGLTVYPEVTRNGSGDVIVVFMPQVANSIYTALITVT